MPLNAEVEVDVIANAPIQSCGNDRANRMERNTNANWIATKRNEEKVLVDVKNH